MGDMELLRREAHLIVSALKRHLVHMEAVDSNVERIARAIHDEKVRMARETNRLIEMLNEAEGKDERESERGRKRGPAEPGRRAGAGSDRDYRSGGSDMGWGFLTMTAADCREDELDELAEGGCTCDECEYAYHGVGEMDDDSFAVEPWSEHVFCALRRAMVLETHRPCADWIG